MDAANQLREEQEEATQESEVEEEPEHHESPVSRPHKSPIKSPLSLKKEVHSEAEVRKSGRIASKDSPEPGRNSGVRRSSRRKDSTPAPEPVPVEPDLQPELAPEPEQAYVAGVQQPVEGVHDGEPVEEELEPTQKDPVSEDEKSDSSRSPSPGLPVIRKSSMSFASLPARTTLGGKKSLGARATRDSHIDQPPGRQTTGRAGSIEKSFIKSLGENSRPLAALQTPAPPSAKKGKKRNSDGHVIDEMVDNRQEDIIMHETQETTKIPTKTGSEEPEEDSRRKTKVSLHDKIQLLQSGKMKNRYLPPPDHEPEYPSLLSMDLDRPEEPIMKTPGMESGRLKKSLEALREPYQSALEEDRDMDLSDSRPYNRVQADVPMMNDTFSRNHSPVLRPSPLRTEAYPTIPARNASPLSSPFTRDPETGPPSSPLKKAFSYNSVVDVHDRGTLPSSPRRALPTEEDFSQTKTSMSTMTQKAKDMWMRNDTGTVTRSEIASPPTKRWQGDDVFRSPRLPAKSQSYDRLDDTLKRSLYPELATRSSSEIIDERQVRSPRAKSRMEESPRTWSRMEETPRSKTRLDDYPRQTSPKRTIGRQTRSSKTRDEMEWQSPAPLSRTSSKKLREEEEEAKALAEAQERQRRQEEQLRREKELLRKMQEQQRRQAEEDRRAAEEERRRIEEERRQLEEERRRHEEEIRARDQAERDRASAEAYQEPEEEYEREEGARSRAGSVDPERAQSRLQQKGSLRMQRPSEFSKPPLRLTKSAPKVKPPPTTIKIGTASQRELMDQRRINTTGGPSVSQLKSAFEPPPQRPESRSAAPAPPAARKVRSLEIAAMQRQREQETLEKKQAEKRELEKRKAEKRKTQEEEQRRMQAARQRPTTAMSGSSSTTTSGPTKTLNRVPQMSNLRQPSQEPEGGKTYGKLNYAKGPGGSIKRVLPQDEDHAPREQPPSRNIPSRLGVPSYQQDGQKKRRTNDFNEDHHMDDQPQPPQRLMQQQKGPIRNSMLGKGGPGSMLPSKMPMHGYTSASNNPATQHSTIKTVGPPSAATGGPGKKLPHVDSVKYSQEKIRFAGEATPGAGAYGGSFKTPHAKSTVKGKKAKTPAAESPLYQNGEDIELPQIPTEYVSPPILPFPLFQPTLIYRSIVLRTMMTMTTIRTPVSPLGRCPPCSRRSYSSKRRKIRKRSLERLEARIWKQFLRGWMNGG